MNWGLRIIILYLSFVALIVTLVSLCMGQKVELVSKDYYKQELEYQGKIDAIKNAEALNSSPEISMDQQNLYISVTPEFLLAGCKGEVIFFRPSDSSKDVTLEIQFNAEGKQTIPKDKFQKGLYKAQLSWVSGNKKYYKEEALVVD